MEMRSAVSASERSKDYPLSYWTLHHLIKEMRLSAFIHPCARPARARARGRARAHSRIHVVHADPVIVTVNPRARDLVKLFQLASADLAGLPVGNLDLGIVTENYNHSPGF